MTGFLVDEQAVQAHRVAVGERAARLDGAAAAATHPLPPNAYGVICGFFAAVVGDVTASCRDSVSVLAAATADHGARLGECLTAYRAAEDDAAAGFAGPGVAGAADTEIVGTAAAGGGGTSSVAGGTAWASVWGAGG